MKDAPETQISLLGLFTQTVGDHSPPNKTALESFYPVGMKASLTDGAHSPSGPQPIL